jgi:hypothetical protein
MQQRNNQMLASQKKQPSRYVWQLCRGGVLIIDLFVEEICRAACNHHQALQ